MVGIENLPAFCSRLTLKEVCQIIEFSIHRHELLPDLLIFE